MILRRSFWRTVASSVLKKAVSAAGSWNGLPGRSSSDTPHTGWVTDQRFNLPHDVAPGASVTISVSVTAPNQAGSYVLRHRMVKEQVAWFTQIQKTNVTVN